MSRPLVLAAILIGIASAAGFIPWQKLLNKAESAVAEVKASGPAPESSPVYRWKDAQGNLVMGSNPPPGVKATKVEDNGRVTTMPAIKVPPPESEHSAALPEGKSMQQALTDRAIEQSTR